MKGRIVGFDFGRKRIGAATGNLVTGTTQPLATIRVTADGPDWSALGKLVSEWRPQTLVVGLPLHMDGRESDLSDMARGFAEQLRNHTGLPVTLVDERLSSSEADNLITLGAQPGKSRHRRRRELRDSVAAELIVRTYLADNPAPSCNP